MDPSTIARGKPFRHAANARVDDASPTHVHDHVAMADADANGHETRRLSPGDRVDDGDRCGYGHDHAPYLHARVGGCDVLLEELQPLWPSSPLPDIQRTSTVPRELARQPRRR